MFRTLYALSVVSLLAGTAWAAAGVPSNTAHAQAGLGLVLLTALQR
jgi:hypothetical protein